MLVLAVVERMPLDRGDEAVLSGVASYAVSFATSLLCGLCIVSAIYSNHYCKAWMLFIDV